MANVDITKPIQVQIMNGSSVIATYTFTPIGNNCNDVYYLKYINKWGVWDYIYFQGRVDNEINTEYEVYKYNNTVGFFGYNIGEGSYHKYITNGKVKVILNTGWVDELYNPKFEDLMLSEYVLLNGNDPVIVTDKDMKFKTNKWDHLINYIITVEKAYDEINQII